MEVGVGKKYGSLLDLLVVTSVESGAACCTCSWQARNMHVLIFSA